MPGIEFVDADSDGFATGDELPQPPRRPVSRWLIAVVVAVLALGAVVAVLNHTSHPTPRATASASASVPVPSPSVSDDGVPGPQGFGPDLRLPSSPDTVLDVATAGADTWVLRSSVISVITKQLTVTSPVPQGTEEIVSAQLVVDAPAGLVWAVFGSGFDARVVALRALSLRAVSNVSFRGAVQSAAALDGRLYLTLGDRILAMTRTGQVSTLARPQAHASLGEVVADPSRHRLLVVSAPGGEQGDSRLWAVAVPSGRVQGVRRTVVQQATVAVANTGAIWLAGHDDARGVLMSLDPDTLEPLVHSPFDPILEPAATLVSGGDKVVWVRDTDGSALRCIDARTGAALQTWLVDGPVASGPGRATLGYGTRAATLSLRSCPG